jgi:hypothetical protein
MGGRADANQGAPPAVFAAELGERYWAAGRRERGAILDAFCLTTGYSRKYAISVLRGRKRKPRRVRRPRRRHNGKAFQAALAVTWEAAGYICAERLRPFLRNLLLVLEGHRQLAPEPETFGVVRCPRCT